MLLAPPTECFKHMQCCHSLSVHSAHKHGYFTAELIPMETKGKKGVEPFVSDEHPRETTPEKLGKLAPVFKENGCVTAGNASVSELCVC